MANAKNKQSEKYTCSICGESKAIKSNFYTSSRKEYKISSNGYCPICKKCLSNMLIDIDTKSITIANFKKVLSYLDMVYIPSLFIEISENEKINANNFIGSYKKALNLKKEWKNLKFADSVRFEYEQEIARNEVRKETDIQVTDEIRRFWGRGLSNEDYLDLQENYDNFTANEKNMDYKKQSDYKTLCIYELQKSKIQYNLDCVGDVQKLQGLIDNLSSSLGIQAIQKIDELSNDRLTLGLIARYYEDIKREPIRRWVEDFGNEDKFKDIIETFYLGGILQAMKIPNPKEQEFREKIEPYSVKMEDKSGDE